MKPDYFGLFFLIRKGSMLNMRASTFSWTECRVMGLLLPHFDIGSFLLYNETIVPSFQSAWISLEFQSKQKSVCSSVLVETMGRFCSSAVMPSEPEVFPFLSLETAKQCLYASELTPAILQLLQMQFSSTDAECSSWLLGDLMPPHSVLST